MIVPGDLLTDADLIALDATIEDTFGSDLLPRLADKRRIAVADWLAPRLEKEGYSPSRHRTRQRPTFAQTYTSAAYADVATACGDASASDVDLSTVLASPSTDGLYVGHNKPFAGLFVNLTGATVNANVSAVSVSIWNGGAWTPVRDLSDDTQATNGICFSRGGRITWQQPDEWAERTVEKQVGYWAKVAVSSTLTAGTAVNQVLPIVRSRLAFPVGLYTLSLIYREGSSGRRGQWLEQANDYAEQAEKQLSAVLPLVKDEFDMDYDDAVSATEAEDARPTDDRWTLERG